MTVDGVRWPLTGDVNEFDPQPSEAPTAQVASLRAFTAGQTPDHGHDRSETIDTDGPPRGATSGMR